MVNIRNFAILSHIDHGKSTLADRFLELTNTIEKRKMREQFLDKMPLEREKGITIKLHPIRMEFEFSILNSQFPKSKYILNMVDTPGHVDFSYEVSRSLKAVEGIILLVDAVQGIQAQTVFNYYLAKKEGLSIIPVINKIDLPSAQPEKIAEDLSDLINCKKEDIIFISAKFGTNVKELTEKLIEKIPSPKGNSEKPLKALIFDSFYDEHRGIIAFVRIFDGKIKKEDPILFLRKNKLAKILEVGVFGKEFLPKEELSAGQIGYILSNLREIGDCEVGDTITLATNKAEPLPGYQSLKPMVFASFYPSQGEDFLHLKKALEKLSLNDPSLTFEAEQFTDLGYGFRCGFLGPLHLQISQERLEREYNLNIISTSPQVSYKIVKIDGKSEIIYSLSQFPDLEEIKEIQEPWLKIKIFTPFEFLNPIFNLLKNCRALYKDTEYLSKDKLILFSEMPLNSILEGFYDKLKSISSGFASFDWEFLEYRKAPLVRVDILVAGKLVPALSFICISDEAFQKGKNLIFKLKKLIPRKQFTVALQAAIGSKIIARENIPALRKDVTAPLYGGDRTRKDKLLKKQKEGKKRLKRIGKVDIPQEAFFALLKK